MLKRIKLYLVPGLPSRSCNMIEQGLKNHPNVELVEDPYEGDFILLHNSRYQSGITKFNPDMLVYMDFSDKGDVKPPKAAAVFRRTSSDGSPFHPITFAVMDEFIQDRNFRPEIDLGCYLRKHPWHLRRDDVVATLKKYNWGIGNGTLDPVKTMLRPVNNAGRGEFNKEYFKTLYNTRLNVTCTPAPYSLGDWRTWECLVTGATVFMDELTFRFMRNPLQPNIHYISYDPSCKKGLDMLVAKLDYYINYENGTGEMGRDFVLKYHRSVNRIDDILSLISPEHVLVKEDEWWRGTQEPVFDTF